MSTHRTQQCEYCEDKLDPMSVKFQSRGREVEPEMCVVCGEDIYNEENDDEMWDGEWEVGGV